MKKFLLFFALFSSIVSVAYAGAWDPTIVCSEFDGANIKISWEPITYTASNYSIYRSSVTLVATSDWDALTALTTVAQSVDTYVDAVPLTYTAYYYRIKNFTTALDGVFSNIVNSSPYPEPIVSYAGYDSKVILEWAKASDTSVQYYNVYRSTNAGIIDALLTGKTNDNKYIDYSTANLIKYYFRIQPVTTQGGSFSQAVTVTPFALPFIPSNVAKVVLGTTVTMTWVTTTARASYDIAGYSIYRSTSQIISSDFIALTLNGYFLDTGLTPGTRYNYQVRTTDVNFNVSAPVEFSVLIPGSPAAPVNIQASTNALAATITWNYNSSDEGVTSYYVYESGSFKGTTGNNYYADSSVTLGGAYLYTVKANNSYGLSVMSQAIAVTITPSAPQNLIVENGTLPGTLYINWTPINVSENITGYNIYRATSPETFDYSIPFLVTATTYDDSDVGVGLRYYYCISGFSSIEGAKSLTASAVPALTAINVLGLTATAFTNYAYLNWDNEGAEYGVTGYKIYKSTAPYSELYAYEKYVTTSAGTSSSAYVTGLSSLNIPYYLKVTAINFYGEGDTVNASYIDTTMTAVTTPERPTNVTTTSQGDGTIYLSWSNAPVLSNVTSYNVYRSTEAGLYDFAVPVARVTGTNYTDHVTSTAGTVYYYEIKSQGSGFESLASTEVSGRSFYRPYPVNNLTGSYVNGNIWLLWSTPDGNGTDDYALKHYRIYKSTVPIFSGTPMIGGAAVTEDKFIDTDINSLVASYYYKVKTYDTNGVEDLDSSTLQVNIANIQQPPATLVALAGDSKVSLIWRMVTPLYYNIYRREDSNPSYGQPVAYNVSFSLKDYTDTNLINGILYHYIIKAVNSSGEGPASVEVSAKPYFAITLPVDPTVIAQIVNKKEILLNWNAAIGASLAGYYVMRSNDGGGTYTQLTITTQTNYTDLSTSWNQVYYYLIKTLDVDGHVDAIYTPVKIVLPQPSNKIRVYRNLLNLSKGDTLKLRYILIQGGTIKFRVYTLTGAFVIELANADITGNIDEINPYESADIYWDGKNQSGEKVASGVYLLSLETNNLRVVEKVAVVK